MSRYARLAPWYDALSAEPVYRVGRERAIAALDLRAGSCVLDVGCGTGLNFPGLLAAVGDTGHVVGVDSSPEMLEVARRRSETRPPGNVVLVEADAEELDPEGLGPARVTSPFDAAIFTYSLSLMDAPDVAWDRTTALVRTGGRVAVVDMQPPRGRARLLAPAARLACRLGGADIEARPWTLLAGSAEDVVSWSLRGGHVQVWVGTLRATASPMDR